jgi:Ca2+:H+ antiporter
MTTEVNRRWASGPVVAPLLAVVVLALCWGREPAGLGVVVVLVGLAVAVLSAVHHAEVVAHRVGEPFGSLVLAVAVTVIEVGLITTLMLAGGPAKAGLARDTVFAALMITCNGIVGLSLLLATRGGRIASFNAEGSGAALATTMALAVLTLVLPSFTTSTPGPTFSGPQLVFASVASLTLYVVYVLVQTRRHRDYFLPASGDDEAKGHAGAAAGAGSADEAAPVSTRTALASLGLLLVALVAVVGLAKTVSPWLESAVSDAGLPLTAVGVAIALLVLLPESLAAARAALRGHVQTSINLGYGSAMASIGLTIPAIAVVSVIVGTQLQLGLNPTEMVLLALTAVVGILTVTPGRATVLHAAVLLSVFAGFLVLAVSP